MRNPIASYILKNHFLAAILILVLGWILFQIKDILIIIFISYIIMAALYPFVRFLKNRKVPGALAVFITYFVTLLLFLLLIFPLVPFFTSQIQDLLSKFPDYVRDTAKVFNFRVDPNQVKSIVGNELGAIGKNVFSVTSIVFGGIFSALTIFVVSFYLMIDYDRIKRGVINFFPQKYKEKTQSTAHQIEEKLGGWVRGQILLSLFIGAITWAALTLLGISFALPLALIAAFLEIIPTIGPIMSAIPAIVVALAISPTMALVVAGLYLGIQIIENNLLVPKIMEKAVGLNPIIIILLVVTGTKLMGITGALLSIPFASMLIILFTSLKNIPAKKE